MLRAFKIILAATLLLNIAITSVWAEDSGNKKITLNEAISMSLKTSNNLQSSSMDIDKGKEQRQSASDKVNFIPAPGGGSANPSDEINWYSLLSADLNWQMSKKNFSVQEDKTVLDICQKYWSVQDAVYNVSDKEKSVKLAEMSLRRTQLMVDLGMAPPDASSGAPQSAIEGAKGVLAGKQSTLEKAKNDLNKAYEAFNLAVGLDAQERPELTDEIKYEPMPDTDLNYAVQKVLETSPDIWKAEQAANLAHYATAMTYATGQYTPSRVRALSEEQSKLAASSIKDSVAQATRGLYYSVRNLEANIEAAQQGVKVAEESLRVTKLMYYLGMKIQENVVKAELDLADAQQALTDLIVQHSYLVLGFQKPWAVNASGQ